MSVSVSVSVSVSDLCESRCLSVSSFLVSELV